MAEWWSNECGGVFCSNCGYFHDDYWDPAPKQCQKCGSIMSYNLAMTVDKEYRLSALNDLYYKEEDECPEWLLELRKELEVKKNAR